MFLWRIGEMPILHKISGLWFTKNLNQQRRFLFVPGSSRDKQKMISLRSRRLCGEIGYAQLENPSAPGAGFVL
jgi:hypothetical protein